MRLTNLQALAILACIIIGTMLTRFLPFILFPENKKQPKLVSYLSTTIPAAMMGLLLVYCLKGVQIKSFPHGIPELISISFITAIHLWKRNVLLSIGFGTVLYIILVNFFF